MSRLSSPVFDHLADLPAESYADHMVLAYRYTNTDEFYLQAEIDYKEQFVSNVFQAFGGTAVSRVLEFSAEEVKEYVEDWENQDRFGVYAYPDIYKAALRFLSGQETDEACQYLMNQY